MKSFIKKTVLAVSIIYFSASVINAQTSVIITCPEGHQYTCYDVLKPDGTISTSVKKGSGTSTVEIKREFTAI